MKSRTNIHTDRAETGAKAFLRPAKTLIHSKTFLMFALLAVCLVSQTFAADAIDTLDSWSNNLLSLFSSGWVKAICCLALVVEAIVMIFAGQQGGGAAVFKKFAPWIIGTLILLCASGITGYFLNDLEFESFSSFLMPQEDASAAAALA